jgi:SAM-dependent methyltransferase
VSEWWQSFFDGRWGDVQLEWARSLTEEQVDHVEERLRLLPGSDVLDVPCGEGRIGRALAGRGHRVTGVDLTERFLREGRRMAEADGVQMEWVRADMRDLEFDGSFDAVVNYWGSFGYFDAEGDRRFAAGVARALRPGGRFLVDTHTLETVLPEFEEHLWQRVGEHLVLQEVRFDHETSRVETAWTFVGPDGGRAVQDSSIRLYSYAELTALLAGVGFVSFEAVDPTSGEPFALGADRLTVIATKSTEEE